jgi:protein-tyrosine phosphatase
MIDLHSHLLPGLDDGAPDLSVSLEMARAFVADGVHIVACTPHILPGMYHNTGPGIRAGVAALQAELDRQDIPLTLVTGSDAHVTPDMIAKLRSGEILSLADTRYLLVEPPHHVAPARLDDFFFSLLAAGYVPILTHPERLSWIATQYSLVETLFERGVWMQITAGSLTGMFGRQPKYWAERMLDEGRVHILATDAHEMKRRVPELSRGRDAAALRVGPDEAEHMVVTRPEGILANALPSSLPAPSVGTALDGVAHDRLQTWMPAGRSALASASRSSGDGSDGLSGRLRRFFGT